jgi:AAA ATPase domain
MAVGDSAPGGLVLQDRRAECAVLDGLLDRARAGRSGTLVLEGEAGVGKTALLDYAIGSASGLRVLRAAGVESETELAFAALHQCARRCSIAWTGFPVPSGMCWRRRSD